MNANQFNEFLERHHITGDEEGIRHLKWLNGMNEATYSDLIKTREKLLLRNKVIINQTKLLIEVGLPDPTKL